MIVARVRTLLSTPPLSMFTPLVVDRTGVGAGITDMLSAIGLRPHCVTITRGDSVVRDGPLHTKVPKRELVGLLVCLFQTERLKVASSLDLAGVLVNELINIKLKVSLQTGHDSYESWRESIHDDLVLATALACWHSAKPVADPTPAVGPPDPRLSYLSSLRPSLGRP